MDPGYLQQIESASRAQNIVVKVGSRILTREGRVDIEQIRSIASQLSGLASQGRRVSLVSSGAVASAMSLLNSDRPVGLSRLQAYAAVGQAELIHHYSLEFEKHDQHAAQVLLTSDDMNHRRRYLNLRNTFFSLFELGAIPIVNENDCVATEEIALTFGDNDRLAANVAMLVDADLLVVLSDVDALYDRDPSDPTAKRLSYVEKITADIRAMADERKQTRALSKGGMTSKIKAADMATSVGIATIVADGRAPDVLHNISRGQAVGTFFAPALQSINSRKRWIRGATELTGQIIIDSGAVTAICANGKSLLPIGVKSVEGKFEPGDLVSILNEARAEVARGITNYDYQAAAQIKGKNSEQVFRLLGKVGNEELIHRNNLVIVTN